MLRVAENLPTMTFQNAPQKVPSRTATASTDRILVVEDDRAVQRALRRLFEAEGYAVQTADDGASAIELFRSVSPSAVVLDLRLPGMSGRDVCSAIKERAAAVPIIVLSAASDVSDKVLLLELGADDYVTKPFSPRELVTRVRTLLRRASGPPDEGRRVRTLGPVMLDPGRRQVTVDGAPLSLTPTEFDLLGHLLNRPGRVFTREELLASVWGYASAAGTRTVDVHVAQVRAKLGDAASLIRTVRGVGYTADA
jgi:two-component system, OmpR family, response regulator